jgi:hypothetical protein
MALCVGKDSGSRADLTTTQVKVSGPENRKGPHGERKQKARRMAVNVIFSSERLNGFPALEMNYPVFPRYAIPISYIF